MTIFKDFCQEKELFINRDKFYLASSIEANVTNVLLPIIGVLSAFDNTKKVEEFSKEVANAAKSDDVMSEVSQQIGEPKENESEQEFVERANNVLRKILKKKFKV